MISSYKITQRTNRSGSGVMLQRIIIFLILFLPPAVFSEKSTAADSTVSKSATEFVAVLEKYDYWFHATPGGKEIDIPVSDSIDFSALDFDELQGYNIISMDYGYRRKIMV